LAVLGSESQEGRTSTFVAATSGVSGSRPPSPVPEVAASPYDTLVRDIPLPKGIPKQVSAPVSKTFSVRSVDDIPMPPPPAVVSPPVGVPSKPQPKPAPKPAPKPEPKPSPPPKTQSKSSPSPKQSPAVEKVHASKTAAPVTTSADVNVKDVPTSKVPTTQAPATPSAPVASSSSSKSSKTQAVKASQQAVVTAAVLPAASKSTESAAKPPQQAVVTAAVVSAAPKPTEPTATASSTPTPDRQGRSTAAAVPVQHPPSVSPGSVAGPLKDTQVSSILYLMCV